jgi:phage-related baseplate assembly protein
MAETPTDLDPELAALPAPAVIESLDFETIFHALLRDFIRAHPGYTALLASDPAIKLLEVAAYRELLLRNRINEAARSNLLAFALDSDLDHLGAFYGVIRLSGESDDFLRRRIRARIMGWATAGAAVHYRYWALSASSDIADVAVDSPEPGRVRIAVLPTGHDAEVPESLLEAVRAVVLREDVRVLTDTVEVVPVTLRPVTVSAQIWLYPDTDMAVFDALEANLMTAVEREALLGWDLTRSWLISQLHRPGVQRVVLDSPSEETVVAPNEAARIVATEITFAGRDR